MNSRCPRCASENTNLGIRSHEDKLVEWNDPKIEFPESGEIVYVLVPNWMLYKYKIKGRIDRSLFLRTAQHPEGKFYNLNKTQVFYTIRKKNKFHETYYIVGWCRLL